MHGDWGSKAIIWLSIPIIFLVVIFLITLFIPLVYQLSFSCHEEIELEITCSLGFIPVYSRQYQFSVDEFFDDYIKPFLTKKNNKNMQRIKKIKLNQLNWQSTIGLEHADKTAISVSLLMTLKSIIARALIHYFNQPASLQYEVNPNYNQLGFRTDGTCMFSLKLGQAIYTKLKR